MKRSYINTVFILLGKILGIEDIVEDVLPDDKESPGQKRKLRYMPLISVAISLVFLSCDCTIDIFVDFLAEKNISIPDFFKFVINYIGVPTLYVLYYRKIRKIIIKKLLKGNDEKKTEKSIQVYIKDKYTDKYYITPTGKKITIYTQILIVINILAMIFCDKYVLNGSEHIDTLWIFELSIIIVFLEILYYLDYGECKESTKIENTGRSTLGNLVKYYKLFAKTNKISLNLEREIHKEIEDIDNELMKYIDDDNLFQQYLYRYLKWTNRIKKYNISCINTVNRLIKKQNIFYASSFYKDFDICISFPIFISLLKKEKALILVEDTGNLPEIVEWLRNILNDIHKMDDLWKVGIIDDAVGDIDVGVLSFQQIYRGEKIFHMDEYLRQVSYGVILEASDLLVGGQEAITYLNNEIGKDVGKCTWLLCDKNTDGMIDVFSEILQCEFNYVSATPICAEELYTAYWSVETEPNRVWKPVRRYLALEAGIIEQAVKNDVYPVLWYGENRLPVEDMIWIQGQYYREYGDRTGQTAAQMLFDQKIVYRPFGYDCQKEKSQILIVEDSAFNLYEISRQFATRGEKMCFVHVLSPNYMFRDFMKSIDEIMKKDPKFISQIVPGHVKSLRNISVKIIRQMLEKPVSKIEIEKLLLTVEDKEKLNVDISQIRKLIEMLLEVENAQIEITYQSIFSEKEKCLRDEPYYFIIDEKVRKEFKKYFQRASYIDESGNKQYINKLILAGHLEQKYVAGQYVTLNGRYYEVKGVTTTDYEKVLRVERASDHVWSRLYYRQNRIYNIIDRSEDQETNKHAEKKDSSAEKKENAEEGRTYKDGRIVVKRYRLNIEACTKEYVVMKGWNQIASGREVTIIDECNKRKYDKKQILKVEIDSRISRGAVCHFAMVFQESLCTFFPQYYYLLSVAINRGKFIKCGISEKIMKYVLADIDMDSENCFYVVEDSKEDMGILRAIEDNFERILDVLLEYIQWNLKSKNEYLKFGEK